LGFVCPANFGAGAAKDNPLLKSSLTIEKIKMPEGTSRGAAFLGDVLAALGVAF